MRPTAAFAAVTTVAFVLTYFITAHGLRDHNDAWLRGEAEVLRQVSLAAPPTTLPASLVQAVATSALREVAGRGAVESNGMIFFLQADVGGEVQVWIGPSHGTPVLVAVRSAELPVGKPRTVTIPGHTHPFRVVRHPVDHGDIYLGLSDLYGVRVMDILLGQLAVIWIAAVALAWLMAFVSARRLLARVESMTTAAARVSSDDLSTRLPTGGKADEIGYLARTLNGMLDRIAGSVSQLRSLTDTVAHELKGPVTSIRGQLENALTSERPERWRDAAILAIEDLDRLAAFVTTTLDVAEADGGGLRLHPESVDFTGLVRSVIALYEPAFAECRQVIRTALEDDVTLRLDASLTQRAVANVLDNVLRHCPAGTAVDVTLTTTGDEATLGVEDDGPGFPAELQARMFERFVKAGPGGGHGLGLAFARAIAVAHGGTATAGNRPLRGAFVRLVLPGRP